MFVIRTSPLRFLAAITVLVLVTSCASYDASQAAPRSPYEQAKLQYTAAALDYEFTMKTLETANKARLLTNAHRKTLNEAQATVKEWTPLFRSMLDAWGQFGAKPAAFDATLKHLTDAFADVKHVHTEVGQ